MSNIQELIALTPDQLKAWKRLEKAHKDFIVAGGAYYSVMHSIYGYNQKNVESIEYIEDPSDDRCTQNFYMPSIVCEGFDSFADDSHAFVMKVKK